MGGKIDTTVQHKSGKGKIGGKGKISGDQGGRGAPTNIEGQVPYVAKPNELYGGK